MKPWTSICHCRSKTLPKKTRTALIYGNSQFPGILKTLEDHYSRASEGLSRMADGVHVANYLPRLPRATFEARELGRKRERYFHRRFHRHAHGARPAAGEEVEIYRPRIENRRRVIEEIQNRMTFLSDVGLDYLSLDRSSATLSGGEAQRIRLATQIGSKLRGVLVCAG